MQVLMIMALVALLGFVVWRLTSWSLRKPTSIKPQGGAPRPSGDEPGERRTQQ